MTQDQIDSLVRSLAKIAGGILTAHGAVAAATVLNSTNVLELISGLVMAGISLYASHSTHADAPVVTSTGTITTAAVGSTNTTVPVPTPIAR